MDFGPPSLIVLSEEQLRSIVEEVVRDVVLGSAPRERELLSTNDMAERVGVCADTVRRWVSEGDCPHVRAGRKLRFRAEHVIAWLEERSG